MEKRRRPSLSLFSAARKIRRLLSGAARVCSLLQSTPGRTDTGPADTAAVTFLAPHFVPAGGSSAREDPGGAKPGAATGHSPTAAAPLLAVAGAEPSSSSSGDGASCSIAECEAVGVAAALAPSGSSQQQHSSLSSSSGAGAGGSAPRRGLFPDLSSSITTAGSLASSGASTIWRPSCAAPLFADPAAAAERQVAAAATARAELACTLAPLVPAARRPALTHASVASLAQLAADVAGAADGRALVELLAVSSKAARLSPDLRAATLPAAVGILSAAAARINPICAERLPLEMRVPRTAALMLHTAAERAWPWAPRATDPPHTAALKEEGRQYMRSLW